MHDSILFQGDVANLPCVLIRANREELWRVNELGYRRLNLVADYEPRVVEVWHEVLQCYAVVNEGVCD